MANLNETSIEELMIERLVEQGFSYIAGPEIALDGSTPMRQNYSDVLLEADLIEAINRLSPILRCKQGTYIGFRSKPRRGPTAKAVLYGTRKVRASLYQWFLLPIFCTGIR